MSYEPKRIFNKYFIFIWIAAFAVQVPQNIFNNTIVPFATSLGFSNAFAGSLQIPFMIMAIAARFFSAYCADSLSRRLAMAIGYASFLIGTVLFNIPALTVMALTLILGRAMQGFGYACSNTANTAAAIDTTPSDRMSIGVGINWSAQGIAMIAGSLLVTLLVVDDSFVLLFIAGLICSALAFAASLFCGYEGKAAGSGIDRIKPSLHDMYESRVVPFGISALFFYIGQSVCTIFAIALAESRGITGGGLFFSFGAVGSTAGFLLMPRLARVIGNRRGVILTMSVMAAANILLAFCPGAALFFISGLLYGISTAMMPLMQSETLSYLPPTRRAAAISTLYLSMDLGMGIGPSLWGFVSDISGYAQAYFLSAISVVFAIVLFSIVSMRPRHSAA